MTDEQNKNNQNGEQSNQQPDFLHQAIDLMPQDQQQAIIENAARISGEPIESITLERALQILGTMEDPDPKRQKIVDKAVENIRTISEKLQTDTEINLDMTDADTREELQGALLEVIKELTQIPTENLKEKVIERVEATGNRERASDEARKAAEQYRENLRKIESLSNTPEQQEKLDAYLYFINAVQISADAMKESLQGFVKDAAKDGKSYKQTGKVVQTVLDTFVDATTSAMTETFPEIMEYLNGLEVWHSVIDYLFDALPEDPEKDTLVDAALVYIRNNAGGKTPEEVLAESLDKQGQIKKNSLIDKAIKAAKKGNIESLPALLYNHTGKIELSIDKAASIFISGILPDPKAIDGQRTFMPLKYEKNGAAKEITLETWYSFDPEVFKKLGIKKEINDFDFFVELAFYNLFEDGNREVSYTQIYKWLNGDKTPNSTHIANIAESITKQIATTIMIDDRELLEGWKRPIPKTYREVVSPLLPAIQLNEKYRANGRIVDGAVKILDYPPLLAVGKKIGQTTTVPKALLENNISHSKWYYPVMHYLLSNIARMRDGTRQTKILYTTLYDALGVKQTATNTQKNVKAKLFEILDHFVTHDYIAGYREETTPTTGEIGVKILLPIGTQKKIAAKKKDKKGSRNASKR